ncbi:MAG: archaetidylserine decarboxylase [Spirochaetota bacterium]
MRHKIFLVFFFKIIPKNFISRAFGSIARLQLPASVMEFVIRHYCNAYKVNQYEIDYPAAGFKSFDEFFTRKLKAGVHKIDLKSDSIVSPVDARIDEFGKINQFRIIQAKGIEYSLRELVPSAMADEFADGSFITLYLSPADYHRIHSPVSGKVAGYFSIPGNLFPVKEAMVNGINGLFSKNERAITYIKNSKGICAVCKIGAMNVGRITLSYADVETNRLSGEKKELLFNKNGQPSVKKGQEIGIFHLGSTVILLFRKNSVKFASIKKGQKIRMGQRIASLK